MTAPTCPFCDIVAHAIPAYDFRLHMMTDVVSFVPLNPVTPGHRLFVPRGHIAFAHNNPVVTGRVFEQAALWGRMHDPSFNLIVNNGVHASQTIFHLHIHYVPRQDADGLHLPWTGQGR